MRPTSDTEYGSKDRDGSGARSDEDRHASDIQRAADRVCALILYSDLPLIDVQIAAANVRRLCKRLMPERAYLYEWIYARRFKRLWDQWRSGERWT